MRGRSSGVATASRLVLFAGIFLLIASMLHLYGEAALGKFRLKDATARYLYKASRATCSVDAHTSLEPTFVVLAGPTVTPEEPHYTSDLQTPLCRRVPFRPHQPRSPPAC
jgi:hypothetical protein